MMLFSRYRSKILRPKTRCAAKIAYALSVTAIAGSSLFASDVLIYSTQDLNISDRAIINGGSVQSGTNAIVGYDARIHGSVYSNGTATVNRGVHIYQDLLTAGAATIDPAAIIDGATATNTSVPRMTIPTKTFTVGSTDKNVPNDGSLTLSPGKYRDINVGHRGKLYLSAGTYDLRKLIVNCDAKIYINISSSSICNLNIRDNFYLYDRTRIYMTGTDIPTNVNIYTNQTSIVNIGYDAAFAGILYAPYAEVKLMDRASWNGELNGKKVSMGYDACMNSPLLKDSDGDGAPDVIEYIATTNPFNAASKPALVREGNWENKTAYGAQEQELDFSHFPGFRHCNSVRVVLPQNSVTGDYSYIYTIDSVGYTSRCYPNHDGGTDCYQLDCGRIHTCGGTPTPSVPGDKLALLSSERFIGLPKEALQLKDNSGTLLNISKVTYKGAIFTNDPNWDTRGTYTISKLEDTYKVSKDFTAEDLKDPFNYKTLNEAFEKISMSRICPKSIVYVAAGTYKPDDKTPGGSGGFLNYFRH